MRGRRTRWNAGGGEGASWLKGGAERCWNVELKEKWGHHPSTLPTIHPSVVDRAGTGHSAAETPPPHKHYCAVYYWAVGGVRHDAGGNRQHGCLYCYCEPAPPAVLPCSVPPHKSREGVSLALAQLDWIYLSWFQIRADGLTPPDDTDSQSQPRKLLLKDTPPSGPYGFRALKSLELKPSVGDRGWQEELQQGTGMTLIQVINLTVCLASTPWRRRSGCVAPPHEVLVYWISSFSDCVFFTSSHAVAVCLWSEVNLLLYLKYSSFFHRKLQRFFISNFYLFT